MSVTRRGHGSGQSAALGPSVQGQVGSMPGCSETQFSFGPQSNTMVAQTQGLSQPGDLTASSTSTQRKSLFLCPTRGRAAPRVWYLSSPER